MGGEGGGGWAWTGARKTLFFMAGAVRAAGVGHGTGAHCFSWQGRWRGGGEAFDSCQCSYMSNTPMHDVHMLKVLVWTQ